MNWAVAAFLVATTCGILSAYAEECVDLLVVGGYGLGPDMDDCLRELAFARALLACGDFCGLGRRTYEQYASDARGVLSAHAKAILARHKSIP